MKLSHTIFICLVIYTFLLTIVNAQENSNYKKLISETNTMYGSNDLLHSGEIYQPEHTHAKGDPYFLTNDYSPALVTVKGNVFENITARYNIETDRLVILTPADSNSVTRITVKQNWLDSFKIYDHLFVNISNFDSTRNLKGYYELVYRGKKSFFIKYSKRFIDTYNDLSPAGFYSVVKTSFCIFDGSRFTPVKNKKMFLQLFAENKAPVKKYLRTNKIKFSKASSSQLKKLMQFSDDLPKPN